MKCWSIFIVCLFCYLEIKGEKIVCDISFTTLRGQVRKIWDLNCRCPVGFVPSFGECRKVRESLCGPDSIVKDGLCHKVVDRKILCPENYVVLFGMCRKTEERRYDNYQQK